MIYYYLSQFNHVHAAMVVNKAVLQTRNRNYSIIVLAMKKNSNGNKLNRLRRCIRTEFLILLKSFNNFCIELTNLLHDASGFLYIKDACPASLIIDTRVQNKVLAKSKSNVIGLRSWMLIVKEKLRRTLILHTHVWILCQTTCFVVFVQSFLPCTYYTS